MGDRYVSEKPCGCLKEYRIISENLVQIKCVAADNCLLLID
jgi:hypothetical protein